MLNDIGKDQHYFKDTNIELPISKSLKTRIYKLKNNLEFEPLGTEDNICGYGLLKGPCHNIKPVTKECLSNGGDLNLQLKGPCHVKNGIMEDSIEPPNLNLD